MRTLFLAGMLLVSCAGPTPMFDAGVGGSGGSGGGGGSGGSAGAGGGTVVVPGGCDPCKADGGYCRLGPYLDYFSSACVCVNGVSNCGIYPDPPGPCEAGAYCNSGKITCTATTATGCARACDCVERTSAGTGRWSCTDTCAGDPCPAPVPSGPCIDPNASCRYAQPVSFPSRREIAETTCACAGGQWACLGAGTCQPDAFCGPSGTSCQRTVSAGCRYQCSCGNSQYGCQTGPDGGPCLP